MEDFHKELKNQVLALGEGIIDSLSVFPLGTAVRAMVASVLSYKDYLFLKKIHKFLLGSLTDGEDMSTQIDDFYQSLNTEQREKVGQYLIGYIDQAEHEDKALILGYIFKAAVHKTISHSDLLRLCSIVNQAYLDYLQEMPKYVDENRNVDLKVNFLINYGLIDNELGGVWRYCPSAKLNDMGVMLYSILEKENWFKSSSAQFPDREDL